LDSPVHERLNPPLPRFHEEEKQEDDLENSQSFLNPLGGSITDTSPAFIGVKKILT
jgi:hypothetical protein